MTALDLAPLVESIRAFALARKILPSEVTRSLYIAAGHRQTRLVSHHWGEAKSIAVGDAVPMTAIPEGHLVWGVSTLVGKDGRTKNQWVKTVALSEDPVEMMARVVDRIESSITPRKPSPLPKGGTPFSEDYLAVYPLGDMHLGMYAAAREAGEDWDTEAAMEIACAAIEDLAYHGQPADEALLINVGDFFHSDNPRNRTAKSGNPLDVDGRYFEIMEAGLRLKTYMIDCLLRRHKHVRVWTRVGNHDGQSSLCLAIALQAYYRLDERVTIEVNPSAADYMVFGRVLIGCTHGDTYKAGKPDEMVATMACDRAEDWGQTDHRYWYVGHVHHRSAKEVRGGIVETFRTLAPKDAWHAAEGYRAGRDMNRILIHREDGEVARLTTSVGRLRRQRKLRGEVAL